MGAKVGRCGLVDGEMGEIKLHLKHGLVVLVALTIATNDEPCNVPCTFSQS